MYMAYFAWQNLCPFNCTHIMSNTKSCKIRQAALWCLELYSDFPVYMAYGQQMVQVRSSRIHLWHLSICPSLTRRYFSGFEGMGLDLVSSDFKHFGPLKKGVTGKRCEQNPKNSRLSSACFNPWRQFFLRQYTSIRTTVEQKLKYQ